MLPMTSYTILQANWQSRTLSLLKGTREIIIGEWQIVYNTYYPPIMLSWIPFPDSLKPIHTWAHLVLTTNMNAGWVNNSHVASTTLKLKVCLISLNWIHISLTCVFSLSLSRWDGLWMSPSHRGFVERCNKIMGGERSQHIFKRNCMSSPLQCHVKQRRFLMTAAIDHCWTSCQSVLTAVEPVDEFLPLSIYIS